LAIDQGTTNTKVLLVDHAGAVRARASRAVEIAFPWPGWVEQGARALWASVTRAVDDCLGRAGDAEIAAVGVTNQRESVVVWDRRTGDPAGPCITWQCRRTVSYCEELRERGLEAYIRERSGLPVDPLFSGSKARWLLANIPDGTARAAAGELCIGTVDSWLLWNLTGAAVHATDASNASRTQLLNLRQCRWDEELLRLFGIPEACLPEVHASSGIFGSTTRCGMLPAGVPVAGMIGDSHAALFGHAAFSPGAVKATYGTGSSLMTPVESPIPSAHGLSTTIAWALNRFGRGGQRYAATPGQTPSFRRSLPETGCLSQGLPCGNATPGRVPPKPLSTTIAWAESSRVRYALEGNITNTGGAMQWLADFLGLSGGAEEAAALAATVPDAGGAYLVPAFAGLGAPHWDAGARGLVCGLTRGTTAAHVARATLDSIAYQVRDVFEALRQDAAISAPALFADGGASRNNLLMQFQADILGCPVIRSTSADLSAIGAAWLAGLGIGYWKSLEELEGLPRETARFEPGMDDSHRADLIEGWSEALGRSMSATSSGALG
jgi:glycerol kinase